MNDPTLREHTCICGQKWKALHEDDKEKTSLCLKCFKESYVSRWIADKKSLALIGEKFWFDHKSHDVGAYRVSFSLVNVNKKGIKS